MTAEMNKLTTRNLKVLSNDELLMLAAGSDSITRQAVCHELSVRRGNDMINSVMQRMKAATAA